MLIRIARFVLAPVIAGVVIAVIVLGGCADRPPSTDAGPDPDISGCCDWYFAPWLDSPHDCLCEHTAPGEQRWLTCLGGIVEYTCRGEP